MIRKETVDTTAKPGSAGKLLRVTIAVVVIMLVATVGVGVPARASGATQISGIAYPAADGECTQYASDGAAKMTGDLSGCLYIFVETATCSPSGTYNETGTEIYVGEGPNGEVGEFSTTYRFTAKFEDCSPAKEVFGRCQHPIVDDSGIGDFAGVSGRFDMKDIIEGENLSFDYTGHLRW